MTNEVPKFEFKKTKSPKPPKQREFEEAATIQVPKSNSVEAPPSEQPRRGIQQQTTDQARNITQSMLERKEGAKRYIIQNELARGGMGIIHRTRDQDLKRTSAMKIIMPGMVFDDSRLRSFMAEARITAYLEHPNIIPVHEIGMIDDTGSPYYTMKLVDGEALDYIIEQVQKKNTDYTLKFARHRMLDVFRKVCDAVAYAHSKNVIHRDIKPENIMVGQFGEVLLMDWGLAKYVMPDAEDNKLGTKSSTKTKSQKSSRALDLDQLNFTNTSDGMIKGSLAYLSPEQAFGDMDQIDKQTDIFLLGATLYQILTGRPPYSGSTIEELVIKAEKCDYSSPSERAPQAQIPLALERIVLKAMAPLKENRYHSVEGMIEDIEDFIAGKRVCGRKVFAPGDELITYGEFTTETYVIISGKVEVSRIIRSQEEKIGILGRGDIIGEMASISHQIRSATVRAVEETEVLVITHELMMEELEKLPPWMENIVFSLASRVRTLDENLNPLNLRNPSFPVVFQIFGIFSNIELAEYQDDTGFQKEQLVDEIIMLLGINFELAERVINVLLKSNVLHEDENDVVTCQNIVEMGLLVDYIRYQFQIKGGIKEIHEFHIQPELHAFFRNIVRDLRNIAKDQPIVTNS